MVQMTHALPSFFRYFEQRLRVTEENYREEIALLQLKLVERALEESVLKTADDRYVSVFACWTGILHSMYSKLRIEYKYSNIGAFGLFQFYISRPS